METNKHILGLDLGTNSIGWAMVSSSVDENEQTHLTGIVDAGSRIIPMDASVQSDFAKGNTVSQTKDRTHCRVTRRMFERGHLRRERLHRVLSLMGFLPPHYSQALTRYGKFAHNQECLLAWAKDETGQYQFLFQDSFQEMLSHFHRCHPQMMSQGLKVPYDWTIYYLRKKALTQPISGQELAWILLHFNKKRGYFQTRDEEQQQDDKKKETKEYLKLKVLEVRESPDNKGKDTWYDIILEDGYVYRRSAKEKPQWEGMVKEFILTTQLDENGNVKKDKNGQEKRSLRMPNADDWGLQKIKAQNDIQSSGKTVGAYIFDALVAHPEQKILGQLVRTIDRHFYRDELRQILEAQKQFIPQLSDAQLYAQCTQELYAQNTAYRESIAGRDFTYLLLDDILFYQRPLKSKKSLIDDCPFEYVTYLQDGKRVQKPLKCIAKSHPLYQEFRLWQFIANLRIYEKSADGIADDVDVTAHADFLPDEESRARLFDYLYDKPSITQKELLEKYFGKKVPRKGESLYRWNYPQDKPYDCNETRGAIISRLGRAHIDTSFLSQSQAEERLWEILYSVHGKEELVKALTTFQKKYHLDARFVDAMKSFPPFEPRYGAYSAKAIKKLLSVMRMGHHWHVQDIDPGTRTRIQKILDGEQDQSISIRVRQQLQHFSALEEFRGMPLWLACYTIYNRHGEAAETDRWTSPQDIDHFLSKFRQHSLHNPIVEQVVTETLRTVRDIWQQYGHIDEIHVEMGRDIKNPADKRKQMSAQMQENENTNLRIRALLTEFMNPEFGIEDVRPFSPSQQELLRIYEDTALHSVNAKDLSPHEAAEYDAIQDIIRKFADSNPAKRPSHADVLRYKVWLEQHYVSPYTGEPIPLARLFTRDYEIEHIIPQSRYFDDSLSNKVICEAEVNKRKDNRLGLEFIKACGGEIITLNGGRQVHILCEDAYCTLVEKTYRHNRAKMKKLLLEDIPDEFIQRQLNDSRYISKLIKGLLSHIVREEGEQEATSKNVVVCSGAVTDRLKREWGVDNVWNHIILPRFQRMNELDDSQSFTATSTSGHLIPAMPLHLQKGFSKKRIDHRHHAMDAIVIACVTRDHVNLISNEAAMEKHNANRYQLSHKLRRYQETTIMRNGQPQKISVAKEFFLPWPTFCQDVTQALSQVIASFKRNLRIVTRSTNYYQHFVPKNGRMVKQYVRQVQGDRLAIRKPMHKDTVYGLVNLKLIKAVPLKKALEAPHMIVNKELKAKLMQLLSQGLTEAAIKQHFLDNKHAWADVDLKKIDVYYYTQDTDKSYYAVRKDVDTSFTRAKICKEVTDTGIQKILLAHLHKYNDSPEQAFSPEGIVDMNDNIRSLNGGKAHKPIKKVRVCEQSNKYPIGETGNKSQKFVEAAKGTNLFFVVYEQECLNKKTGLLEKKRSYRTIPLYEAIEKRKKGEPLDKDALFILSPNDLVYLPTAEELIGGIHYPLDRNRIYKMVSATGNRAYFVPVNVAKPIVDSVEFLLLNKIEKALTGESIKETCIPLKVDRMGHITQIGNEVYDKENDSHR